MLSLSLFSTSAFAIFLTATAVVADNVTIPDSAGCVDPSGFEQCYQTNSDAFTTCTTTISDRCPSGSTADCLAACTNVQLAANLGCWVQSCWNHMYSCDYQFEVITYLNTADRLQGSIAIPFYPAPVDAPGACVCNLGDVWGNLTVVEEDPCINFVSDGTDVESDCNCCYESSFISECVSSPNIVNACPSNDISSLVSNDTLSAYAEADSQSTNNCAVLDNDSSQCSNTYSIDIYATSWVNPGALPTGFMGSAPLSDNAGEITSLDFDVYTLSLFPAYATVITPAPYNSKNAAATGSGHAGLIGTITTSGSLVSGTSQTGTIPITALVPSSTSASKSGGKSAATTSGAAAATSSKPSSASRVEGVAFGSFVVAIAFLLCNA